MQQYVFKCVRSNRTSAIMGRGGRGGSMSLILSSFSFIWLEDCSGSGSGWLASWLAGLLHFIHWALWYSTPSRKLNRGMPLPYDFKTQSVFKGNFIITKCSRNICDLPMSRCQPSYYYDILHTMYNDQDRYSLENSACWPSKSLKIFKKIPNYAMSTFLYLYDGHNEGEMKFGELCFYSSIL